MHGFVSFYSVLGDGWIPRDQATCIVSIPRALQLWGCGEPLVILANVGLFVSKLILHQLHE